MELCSSFSWSSQRSFQVADLREFLRENNPHNQQIFVIGGDAEEDSFKVVPCNEISSPTPGETAWTEMKVDAKIASKGHRAYVGVSFEPRGSSKFLQAFPQAPNFREENHIEPLTKTNTRPAALRKRSRKHFAQRALSLVVVPSMKPGQSSPGEAAA